MAVVGHEFLSLKHLPKGSCRQLKSILTPCFIADYNEDFPIAPKGTPNTEQPADAVASPLMAAALRGKSLRKSLLASAPLNIKGGGKAGGLQLDEMSFNTERKNSWTSSEFNAFMAHKTLPEQLVFAFNDYEDYIGSTY